MSEKSNAMIVADDNGYAEHKLCYWEGEPGKSKIVEVTFPSRAAIGSQSMSLDGGFSGVYEINGQRWTVGSHVHDPENTRSGGYATSDLNAVLINHSLIHAGVGGKEIRLATGLPFEDYYDEDGIRAAFIKSVQDSVKAKVKCMNGDKPAKIMEHKVFPESTSAWVDFSVDEKGEVRAENENGVAIVDIGGNTTDVTYVNPGNQDINKARSGTREIGVLHVRDKLRSLVKKEFDVDEISDAQLDHGLRHKKIKIYAKDQDVTNLVEQAFVDVGQKVLSFVKSKVGQGAQLDYIVFVGGGAGLLKSVLSTYEHAVVPDNPQHANARGMLKHWTFVIG